MLVYVDGTVEMRRTVNNLLNLFFPGHKKASAKEDAEVIFHIAAERTDKGPVVRCHLRLEEVSRTHILKQEWVGETDRTNETRRVARLATLQLLEKVTGQQASSWGTLTGVRPTKIVHRMLDLGWDISRAQSVLTSNYAVSREKIDLLCGVAAKQRPFLEGAGDGFFNLYLGIPFCPSRCRYCSFPAVAINKYKNLVEPFVQSLCREISGAAQAAADYGLTPRTIYIGGGTPTALSVGQLKEILQTLTEGFGDMPKEFTIEAGRPDTLDEEKLLLFRRYGINRISVNPQTMCNQTLARMGRLHTAEEFVRVYRLARLTGFDIINTDLIVGLPGETTDIVRDTVSRVTALEPENITVHTLALKRASELLQQTKEYSFPQKEAVAKMLSLTGKRLLAMGWQPYYLYRQKNTLGRLENVGYAKPGKECVYNIMMMEERESVIGLGVGSGSKWVKSGELFAATYNPRDIIIYLDRLAMLIKEKSEKCAVLGGMQDVNHQA
ncbi:coproporphyrinogen dehydrogenase HemZ [Metallumcola ferriviriculae]|uniref:Coproporphyrinogen dehydrogenase HemZ n=1 Tax=Metallumcola ferriviriculae TaxID=3039180 RepID=A0AAU0USH2_9FIRM|nr:coproporphyrinogen dehydrogenase HemZ [Desulfitibacteraceae bacterium MK1]